MSTTAWQDPPPNPCDGHAGERPSRTGAQPAPSSDAPPADGHTCAEDGGGHVSLCAAGPSTVSDETNFARIGGQAAVERLVESFYRRMTERPEARLILALHPADLTATKRVLQRYLAEWLGGPALYSQERGHPRLRRRHLHLPIGPEERDAWMLCMRGALDEVVEDAPLRALLDDTFLKLANMVRNDPESVHEHH